MKYNNLLYYIYQKGKLLIISISTAKQYCKDDICLIENYYTAISDPTEWACHHRLEIHKDYINSASDLKMMNLYYKRPAGELIFLKREDHYRLHNITYSKMMSSNKLRHEELVKRAVTAGFPMYENYINVLDPDIYLLFGDNITTNDFQNNYDIFYAFYHNYSGLIRTPYVLEKYVELRRFVNLRYVFRQYPEIREMYENRHADYDKFNKIRDLFGPDNEIYYDVISSFDRLLITNMESNKEETNINVFEL